MNPERLTKCRELVTQIEGLRDQLALVASSGEINLVKLLIHYEDLGSERTSDDQERLELLREQLSENPPYKKVSKPTGPIQPLAKPTTKEFNRMSAVQAAANVQALDDMLVGWGLDTPGVQFQLVDGYGPMLERTAQRTRLAAAKAKAIADVEARMARAVWYKRVWAFLNKPLW